MYQLLLVAWLVECASRVYSFGFNYLRTRELYSRFILWQNNLLPGTTSWRPRGILATEHINLNFKTMLILDVVLALELTSNFRPHIYLKHCNFTRDVSLKSFLRVLRCNICISYANAKEKVVKKMSNIDWQKWKELAGVVCDRMMPTRVKGTSRSRALWCSG